MTLNVLKEKQQLWPTLPPAWGLPHPTPKSEHHAEEDNLPSLTASFSISSHAHPLSGEHISQGSWTWATAGLHDFRVRWQGRQRQGRLWHAFACWKPAWSCYCFSKHHSIEAQGFSRNSSAQAGLSFHPLSTTIAQSPTKTHLSWQPLMALSPVFWRADLTIENISSEDRSGTEQQVT